MSAFRDALRRLVESALRCVKCGAANRPGATYVELDEEGTHAYCIVCLCSGPVAAFQHRRPTDDTVR